MTENEPIKTVSDGITFLSTGRYYDGINRWVAHKLKMETMMPQTMLLARQQSCYLKMRFSFQFQDIMEKPNRPCSQQELSRYILTSLSQMPFVAQSETHNMMPRKRPNAFCRRYGVLQTQRLALESYTLSYRQCSGYRQYCKGCYQRTWLWNSCIIAMSDTLLQREETRSLRR